MHPNKRSKSEQLDTSIHSWENSRKTGTFWKHSRGSRLRKLRPGVVAQTPALRASGMQTCFSGADATSCVEAACSLCHFGHGTLLVTTSRPGIRARHFRIPPQIPFIPQNVAERGKNMGFRLHECRCRSIMTKNENEDDRCGASGFLRGELRFQEAGRRPVRTSTLPPRSCLPREAAGRFHRAPNGAHHRQS